MKRRFGLLFVCALLVTVAACSTAASNKEKADSSASESAAPSAPSATKKESDNPVNAKYLSINLPAEWTSQSGEESFGFQHDGKPVGALDGLGYSETIDGLLPNGANVDSQEELNGMPVKTIMAKLSMDAAGDGGKQQEYHFFYFLAEQKVVYDLRFDADQVKESEARSIASTASVKS